MIDSDIAPHQARDKRSTYAPGPSQLGSRWPLRFQGYGSATQFRRWRWQAFVSYYESGTRRLDLLELRQICRVVDVALVDFVRRFEAALKKPDKT
jgi:hypothetical protein